MFVVLTLSSCVKQKAETQYRLYHECQGLICNFGIEKDELLLITNEIGNTREKLLKSTRIKTNNLKEIKISWGITDGSYPDSEELEDIGLQRCSSTTCTAKDNPTGWVFNKPGSHEVKVSGDVKSSSKDIPINDEETFDIKIVPPNITMQRSNDTAKLDYKLIADTKNTGIPDKANYQWYINGDLVTSGIDKKTIDYIFANAGQEYSLELVISKEGMDKIVDHEKLFSGIKNPDIETKAINSKLINFIADTSESGLPTNTTYKWKVEGIPTIASGLSANIPFDKYNTNYKVILTVTPSGDIPLTIEKNIKTGFGNISIDVNHQKGIQYTLTANTDNTGIDSASNIKYHWISYGQEIGASKTITHNFPNPNQQYHVNLIVTADGKEIDSNTQFTTQDITQPSANAQADENNPLKYKFVADTTGTIIENNWTKKWEVNGTKINGEADTINHTFTHSGTTYSVTYIATSPDNQLTREVTIPVCVSSARAPTLSKQQSEKLKYSLTADLENTGITKDWNLHWGSSQTGVTFSSSASKTTNVILPKYGKNYNIVLTATPPSGSSDKPISSNIDIKTQYNEPVIDVTDHKDLDYTFTANIDDTGIDNSQSVTYEWSIDGQKYTSTNNTISHTFSNSTKSHTINLETTADGEILYSSKSITTGSKIQPSLSSNQVGADPLEYTITADTTGTKIQPDWEKTWSIDGISKQKGTSNTFTTRLTRDSKHLHTISYVAKDGDETRESSINVTIPPATQPSISQTNGDNSLEYNLSTDITNTGITSNWTFNWSSSPSGVTFSSATSKDTGVTLPNYGVTYTLTLTATPPVVSKDNPVVTTPHTISPIYAAPTISTTNTGLKYIFTANIDNTGINHADNVTYTWTIDGQAYSDNSSQHIFNTPNHTYTINLETVADGQVLNSSQSITTGSIVNPSISSQLTDAQGDPRSYTFTASTTGTIIDSTWTKSWKVNGTTVSGATSDTLSKTFELTNTQYNIQYIATKGNITRSAETTITTGRSSAPTIVTSANTSGERKYDLSANLTNTGISDNSWNFAWSSNPSTGVVFTNPNSSSTSVTFPNYNANYTITLTATPKSGHQESTHTATNNINTGDKPTPLVTSITYTGGNYQYFSNGTSRKSGITVKKEGDSITFTCPAGYAIVNNNQTAISPTASGLPGIYKSSVASNRIIKVESRNSVGYNNSFSTERSGNFWVYYRNNYIGQTNAACVPVSNRNDYYKA